MKALIADHVKRGEIRNEWESSEHQATLDGLNAFAARQRARMEQAQRDRKEAAIKVRAIKRETA